MVDCGASPYAIDLKSLLLLQRDARGIALDQMDIAAKRVGNYLSRFKGRGMEYEESRPYQEGDDLRYLDWRVTARTGKAFTKYFREERERPVLIFVDYRAPMFFATRGCFKSVSASRLAAKLAWAHVAHGDRVGSMIISDFDHRETRPSHGSKAVLRMANDMVNHPAWRDGLNQQNDSHPERINAALGRLRHLARPGTRIYLLSDFRGLSETGFHHLATLARHAELVPVMFYDPLEAELPMRGPLPVAWRDKRGWISGKKSASQDWRKQFEQRLAQTDGWFRQHGGKLLLCRTDQDPLELIAKRRQVRKCVRPNRAGRQSRSGAGNGVGA